MRLGSAISLLAAIVYSLIAPAAYADPDSNLPACCRRNGVHHCMMRGMMNQGAAADASSAVQAIRPPCPYFPAAGAVAPGCSRVALPGASQAIFAALSHHPAVAAQTEARYRVSFSRARHKRGPPSPIS